ncbi:hypothetical protein AGMMS4957_20490 [Bacteroidia bacterium]|nr:hypothetical protein AGMMS4957_20490 [Bacteroidia bacterium]
MMGAFAACSWDDEVAVVKTYDSIVAEMKDIQAAALSSPGGRWRELNTLLHDSIAGVWTAVATPGGTEGVYYREVPNSNDKGAVHPIQTAQVVVNYVGKLGSETIFDQGRGAKFTVNGVVTGFSTALQNMVVGDKWEICIPYALGYGTAGSSSGYIPGYSTLFFEIELLEIIQYP